MSLPASRKAGADSSRDSDPLRLATRILSVGIPDVPPGHACGATFWVDSNGSCGCVETLPSVASVSIFYIFYPNTTFHSIFIIFWISYDLVALIRASEDIIGQLLSHDAEYLRQFSRETRIQLLKGARVMMVIEFPVGSFADFSLVLPVVTWEEIVNQVLFLLTL